MYFKIFSSIEQEEFSGLLFIVDLMIDSLLVMDELLSSFKFEHTVQVCDEYADVWEGRVLSWW